ncbi:unnamed protein product [Closterium sp. NIES-53]
MQLNSEILAALIRKPGQLHGRCVTSTNAMHAALTPPMAGMPLGHSASASWHRLASASEKISEPVTARYTSTLPCLAVPSGFLTGFHVPSFSTNLVGVRLLVSTHMGVWIEPSCEITICVDGDTYAPLATFTAEPGSGLYALHTGPRE